MLLTIDFETYYDRNYSLKKLSTTDYLRDPKFEVLIVGFAVDEGPIQTMRPQEFTNFLQTLDPDKVEVTAHHAQFDGAILAWKFGFVPKRYFCTMQASQALLNGACGDSLEAVSEFLGFSGKLRGLQAPGKHWEDLTEKERKLLDEYVRRDVRLARTLWEVLSPALPETEREVLDLTIRMYTDPVLEVDLPTARRGLEEEKERRRKLVEATGHSVTELRGNHSFVALLEEAGVDVPMKPSPTDPDRMIPALAKEDDGFIGLLNHENEHVRALAEARAAVKSTQLITRSERMIRYGEGGKLPIYLKYAAATTWRWAGADKFNAQNFKKGSTLRKAIVAPKDHVIIVADLSQIEARLLAFIAGQSSLVTTFAEGGDPYCELATEIYGFPVTKANIDERFVGKQAVLGLGFTMGWRTFQKQILRDSRRYLNKEMRLSDEFCARVVNTYRSRNQQIVRFWSEAQRWLRVLAMGEKETWDGPIRLVINGVVKRVVCPNETSIFYPGFECVEDGSYVYYQIRRGRTKEPRWIHRGLLVENIIQKLARDIVAGALPRIGRRYRVASSTHDEVLVVAPETEAEEAMAFVLEELCRPVDWAPGLPLAAEAGYAREYSK